ncbi:MAG: class I SAM-dependent methyltransferase [Gemmataceae bacterium]
MNRFLHGVARATFESFTLPAPILEVGSFQVPGQESLIDLRGYFPGKHYIGLDLRAGPGVDRVGSVERLPFATASVGTVIAMSTFEHVRQFWHGFDEVRRVLRPDGAFLVSCPFHFHIHNYPSDYWRFTPEAFKVLLEPYRTCLIGAQGPPDRPANVWALALGDDHPGPTPEQVDRYRQLLRLHAREPLAPLRKLRYQLGRVLCGRRPFAPWLQRESWTLEVVGPLRSSATNKDGSTHGCTPAEAARFTATSPSDPAAVGVGLHRELELPG